MRRVIGISILMFWVMCGITQAAEKERISIQFIVDQAVVNQHGEQQVRERMDEWVLYLNLYYLRSEAALSAELAFTDIRNFTANGAQKDSTTLKSNLRNSTGGFENIFVQADEYGADYTVAIVNSLTRNDSGQIKNLCGSAADVNRTVGQVASTDWSYALSVYNCDSDTVAHEIGHLMGLAHGKKVGECLDDGSNHEDGITSYAMGYAQADCNGYKDGTEWTSIMVGNYLYSQSSNLIPMFSNPYSELSAFCGIGQKCGVAGSADSVRTINEFSTYYSSHEDPDADKLDYDSAEMAACIIANHSGYEANELASLSCANSGITTLGGLNQLTALQNIDLRHNELSNVSELELLSPSKVQSINLTGNDNVMCHQLDSLEEKFPYKVTRSEQCFNIGALIAVLSLL